MGLLLQLHCHDAVAVRRYNDENGSGHELVSSTRKTDCIVEVPIMVEA